MFRRKLSAEMVRLAIKEIAVLAGLPPDRFSTHSLRKGGVTQMRGLGASADDRRDRGIYADGSTVYDVTYDFSTVGLGPLACNKNLGELGIVKPTVDHVARCIPQR